MRHLLRNLMVCAFIAAPVFVVALALESRLLGYRFQDRNGFHDEGWGIAWLWFFLCLAIVVPCLQWAGTHSKRWSRAGQRGLLGVLSITLCSLALAALGVTGRVLLEEWLLPTLIAGAVLGLLITAPRQELVDRHLEARGNTMPSRPEA